MCFSAAAAGAAAAAAAAPAVVASKPNKVSSRPPPKSTLSDYQNYNSAEPVDYHNYMDHNYMSYDSGYRGPYDYKPTGISCPVSATAMV